MKNNTVLRLSTSAGGIRNTTLAPWDTDFAGLKASLSAPVIGPKDGSYFVRTSGTKRKDEEVSQTGFAIVLDGDSRIAADTGEVLEGAPDPQLVHSVLTGLAIPHVIYSSHSNGKTKAEVDAHNAAEQARHDKALAEGKRSTLKLMNTGGAYGADFHKWRCIIPCEHSKTDLERLAAWLIDQLRAAGVLLRNVKENNNWSQGWFLPRVPDEARLVLFKCYASEPGIWSAPAAVEPEPDCEPAAAVEPEPVRQAQLPAALPPGIVSPIEAFNKQFTAGQVLEGLGYTRPNPRVDEWMRPGSTSGQAGVKVVPDLTAQHGRQYVFSHHGDDDPLADGQAHDAFDCFRILHCDGDMAKALNWNPDLSRRNEEAKRRQAAVEDYFAPDETPITVEDALAEAQGAMKGIKASTPMDPGALLDPKFIGWLAVVKHHDAPNWARLEAGLRDMVPGVQVTAIKKEVDAKNRARKVAVEKVKAAATPSVPAAYSYQRQVPARFAVEVVSERGDVAMRPTNVIAKAAPAYLQGLLAFDPSIGLWYLFDGKRWALQDGTHGAAGVFVDLLDLGGGISAGYGADYLASVMKLTEASGRLPLPVFSQSALPFLNGILDMKTRTLAPTTPANALPFVLPYSYDPAADCPHTLAWLLDAVDGDEDMVHFLLCMAAAVLRRIMASKGQVFLTLIGPGGTGKSTFAKLLRELVGKENVLETTFERLAGNKFEGASIKDKLLVLISDADDWGGKVGMLKSLTGGDTIPFERKHQNRSGKGANFVYGGAVAVLANRPVKTEDKTSGWLRRQRVVPFNKVFTDDAKIKWHADGGEDAKLLPEMPGLVNHLLALSENDIVATLLKPPAGVLSANLKANQANNTVAAWLIANCKPMEGNRARIGAKKEITVHAADGMNNGTRSWRAFENSQTHLYPNYLTWCQETGVKFPMSHVTFKTAVWDALQQFGVPLPDGRRESRCADMHGAYVPGIALKGPDDWTHRDLFHLGENGDDDVPEWLG